MRRNVGQKYGSLEVYAWKLLDVGVEVVDQAYVEISPKWARDPKVIALTLLCRTLGNMKGAVFLLNQRLLVEGQVLVRCCVENLICVGALRQTGDAFVEELVRADAASRKKQASLIIESYGSIEEQAETVVRLEEVVRVITATYPKARPLNAKGLSKNNPVGSSYALFSVLSEQAAHVSARSLGRHLGRDVENDKLYLRVDIAPDPTNEQLIACLQELVGTVLAVIVGANEIMGGTSVGRELHTFLDEFEAIRDG